MITFDDPPLNEVALGRTFLPRPDFLVPHFGAFWQLVRNEFPDVAHAPPIFGPNDPQPDFSDVILPRVWLMSADSTALLQLQQNRFHYNWRKTSEKPEYVRFGVIQQRCLHFWELFEEFVRDVTKQPLVPIQSELTYVNIVDINSNEDAFQAAERTLRDSVWNPCARFLPAPTSFAHSYSFDIPGGTGKLQVSTATAVIKEGRSALKLELTVRGKQSDNCSFKEWSTSAHDFLVAAFKDLTRQEMHTVWKLREG